jgi:hypothetical protein
VAISHRFDRLAPKRTLLWDDFPSRQGERLSVKSERKETIAVSGTLVRELTGIVNAIARVVNHFDRDANPYISQD